MAGSGLRFNRWVYYACALVHVLSCAGAVFGWANIAYILQKEGAFSSNCAKGSGAPATCSEQTLQLSNLYSTASVFAFCIPAVSGPFQDRYGPRTTVRILSLIFAIGILLLLGAATTKNDVLYYPAFAALGTAASANLLPLYSVAALFPANRALALSTLSGAFDAGTIVFFTWARLYDQGWPLRQVLIAYLAGPVAVQLLMALFLWPEKPFDSYDTVTDPSVDVASPSIAPGRSEGQDEVSSASASNAGSNATGGARTGAITRTGSHSSLGPARKPSSSIGSVGVSGGELHSPTSSVPGSGSLSIRKVPSLQEAMSSAVSAVMGASPRTPYHKLRVAGHGASHEGHEEAEGGQEQNDEVEIDLAPPALTLPPTNSASEAAEKLEKGRSSRSTGMLQPQGSGHLPPVPEITAAYTDEERAAPEQENLRKAQAGIDCRSPFMPAVDTASFTSLPFGKQLSTPIYLAYLVFFICCIVRFNFYISSVGAQLDAIGQAEAYPGGEAPYSQAFGYILPCGLFFNIAIGTLLDRYGPVLGLATLWLLAILLSILAMIPVLQLQVFTFIVFTAYRGLNFCVMTVFLSAIFGFKTLGSLVGVLTAVAGIIGLVNSALLSWALANPQGPAQFLQPNAFLLGLMLLCGLFPMWLARRTGVGSLLQAVRTGGKA